MSKIHFGALIALPVLLIASACGGSSAGKSAPPPGESASSGAGARPPAVVVQQVPLMALPKRIDLALPPGGAEGLLGDTLDRAAAKQAAADLQAAGIDLKGIDLLVLPVVGRDQRLLVAEVDQSGGSSSLSKDPTVLLKALAASPALKSAKVGRVALDVHGRDKKGPFVMTISLPMTTVNAIASGALTMKQAQNQTLVRVTRGPQP